LHIGSDLAQFGEKINLRRNNKMAGIRETTNRLFDMAVEGTISWRAIAEMALTYMSEDEVADMCRANDIFDDEDED
jgi:hypothetical protein